MLLIRQRLARNINLFPTPRIVFRITGWLLYESVCTIPHGKHNTRMPIGNQQINKMSSVEIEGMADLPTIPPRKTSFTDPLWDFVS
jgi:hypothetical protein